MKLAAGIVPLLLVGCAGNPTSDTGPLARCETTDCFFEREIREFEVIDRQTVVVYVGRQRCPFVVELDGFDCDITFSPEIQFFQGSLGRVGGASSVSTGQVCATTRSLYVYSGLLDPGGPLGPDTPIDPVSAPRTGPGDFAQPSVGDLGSRPIDPITADDVCRVQDIRSINDDQLVELYVQEGITAPPPPIGAGEIEVPEADQAVPAGEGQGDGAGDPGTPAHAEGDAGAAPPNGTGEE